MLIECNMQLTSKMEKLLASVAMDLASIEEDEEVVFWFGPIDRGNVAEFYNHRRGISTEIRGKTILVLNSGGGDADAAYQLVNILKCYCEHFVVFVPLWAKSASTFVCLAAEKIYMTGIAELGPLDIQVREPGEPTFKGALDEYQATVQLRKEAWETFDYLVRLIVQRSGGMSIPDVLDPAGKFVSTLLQPLYYQVDPKLLGRRARQLEVGVQYALRILQGNSFYAKADVDELVGKLVYGYPSHSFVIDHTEAYKLGLPVDIVEPSDSTENLILLLREIDESVSFIATVYELDDITGEEPDESDDGTGEEANGPDDMTGEMVDRRAIDTEGMKEEEGECVHEKGETVDSEEEGGRGGGV